MKNNNNNNNNNKMYTSPRLWRLCKRLRFILTFDCQGHCSIFDWSLGLTCPYPCVMPVDAMDFVTYLPFAYLYFFSSVVYQLRRSRRISVLPVTSKVHSFSSWYDTVTHVQAANLCWICWNKTYEAISAVVWNQGNIEAHSMVPRQ